MKQCVMALIIAVWGLSVLTPVGAQSEKDSVKYKFNPVVVTATKVEGAQRDIAASVSVLDETVIAQAMTGSALELVKHHVPSVFITERAVMGYGVAGGAAGGISIRGVGGSPVTGVLVLRDGRPDIMGMMGHPLPDAYSLEGLERIEVVRGPASFLYGTNAMGGVINLVSKKVREDGFQTRVSGGAGNFNSQKLNVHHGAKLGAFDYYVTASTQRTDGHRNDSDYDGSFFTAHVGYQLSQATSVELNANYSDTYLLDPGTILDPLQNHWYDIVRSGADLTVSHNSGWGESFVKLHGNFGEHAIHDGWRSTDQTVGLMFYHNAQLWKGNTATVGFDFKNYGGEAEESLDKKPFIDYSERSITEYAPYIHMQQMLWQRIVASAGVRVEQHELYGSEVLPKVGLVVHTTGSTSVRASAAKGFRSPAIRELYVFPQRNEALQPERLWNYELGITQAFGPAAEAELVLFQSQGSNLIRMQFPGGRPQFTNSGDFTHTGYEVSLKWFPASPFTISTAWSDLDLGDQTQGAPQKKLTLAAGYDFGAVDVMANVLHAAELFGQDNRQDPLPDYTLVNIGATVSPWKTIGVRLWLKNVLDQDYQTLSGYPMPGRTFMTELSYSF